MLQLLGMLCCCHLIHVPCCSPHVCKHSCWHVLKLRIHSSCTCRPRLVPLAPSEEEEGSRSLVFRHFWYLYTAMSPLLGDDHVVVGVLLG